MVILFTGDIAASAGDQREGQGAAHDGRRSVGGPHSPLAAGCNNPGAESILPQEAFQASSGEQPWGFMGCDFAQSVTAVVVQSKGGNLLLDSTCLLCYRNHPLRVLLAQPRFLNVDGKFTVWS